MDCRSQEKQASTLIWFYSSNRSEILAAAVRLSTFSFFVDLLKMFIHRSWAHLKNGGNFPVGFTK